MAMKKWRVQTYKELRPVPPDKPIFKLKEFTVITGNCQICHQFPCQHTGFVIDNLDFQNMLQEIDKMEANGVVSQK